MSQNLTGVAMIGIVALSFVVGLGIEVPVNHTHFCDTLQITMECDRLSSTEKTCYPNPDTMKGKKYCSSKWLTINREIPIEPEQPSDLSMKCYGWLIETNVETGNITQRISRGEI